MKALIILILIILGIMALRKKSRIVIHRQHSGQPPRKEGEVTLDTSNSKHKSTDHHVGEYVDYTEVKE